MSDQQNRLFVLLGLVAVLAVILIFVWRGQGGKPKPGGDSSGDVYYSGPRRAKWDPNVWVNEQGKVVPPPPGAQPLSGDDPRRHGMQ